MPEPADRPRPREDVVSQPTGVDSEVYHTVPTGVRPMGLFASLAPPTVSGEVGSLGPYRIVKQLGRGGMGAVYAAVDTRLNRRLALKVMLPEFATSLEAKERFLREARAAAQVSHDNVVTVYEADERDGVPYIAMQFLEGYSLDTYLKTNGGPTAFQILRIARETAAGLAAAHKLGLIHRDVKPANLWLEAPDGRVKVLDFGLAKPVDADVELTQSGAVMGTPAYMSPEQGRGLKLDSRSDLFSLGVVLYRLCTGRLPFEGPTPVAVLMAIGSDEPPPVRQLNPTVPESLAALIHQLLAKKPDARPPSADDVVARIRAIAQELETGAAAPAGHGPPHVAAVPLQITALSEANPFAELDATDSVTIRSDPPEPQPASTKPRGSPPWFAAGVVALALLIVGGVIFATKNKDKRETKNEVPAPAVPGNDTGKQPVPTADPDRKAAEYALAIGGIVGVNGGLREIRAVTDLPKGHLTLTAVNLEGNKAVTDAGLAIFKDCKGLTALYLRDTAVSDTGAANFKDCKGLMALGLGATRVTNAGLANFKDCKNLTVLGLGNAVTDAGVEIFKDCKNLTLLYLFNAAVSDAGLANFKDCKNLALLDVRGTQVTAKGLADFHAAVPGCKIEHDGGTIQAIDPDRRAAEYGLSIGGVVVVNGETRDGKVTTDLPKGRFTLTHLNLNDTNATDAGLANVINCQNLAFLHLTGTSVTDAGLATVTNCKDLLFLDVRRSKVTAKGVADFHAALPGCKIEHDGGTIEPK